MRPTVLALALLLGVVGCGGTAPPERLVAVTDELSAAEARELSEAQPALVRAAQEQRDAAWEAVDRSRLDLAEVHAWVAWLKLRTAENLEVIAQRDALAEAAGGVPVAAAAPAQAPTEAGAVNSPRGATPPVRAAGADDSAARTVREAEDAWLRLLATGLTPDARWREAEALLQAARQALERQERARAEELGRRAAFVFEVVRLTRLGQAQPTATPERLSALERAPEATPATGIEASGAPTTGAREMTGAPAAGAWGMAGPPRPTTATPAPRLPMTAAPAPAAPSYAGRGMMPMPMPMPMPSGSPSVIVVPTPPAQTTPAPDPPAAEDAPEERPRSRIISNILQPME